MRRRGYYDDRLPASRQPKRILGRVGHLRQRRLWESRLAWPDRPMMLYGKNWPDMSPMLQDCSLRRRIPESLLFESREITHPLRKKGQLQQDLDCASDRTCSHHSRNLGAGKAADCRRHSARKWFVFRSTDAAILVSQRIPICGEGPDGAACPDTSCWSRDVFAGWAGFGLDPQGSPAGRSLTWGWFFSYSKDLARCCAWGPCVLTWTGLREALHGLWRNRRQAAGPG